MIPLLTEQTRRYPDMEIQDALKLIYQSEFGGGHMISDREKSFQRLCEEYEKVKDILPVRDTVWEPIEDDVCRIYLNAITEGLSEKTLNQMFVLSANRKKGTVDGLETRLSQLVCASEREDLPFDPKKVRESIEEWKQKGYPAVSHSRAYHEAYHPAYRVADRQFGVFYPVFLKIDQYMKKAEIEQRERPVLINIDGMAGSGKSTLGQLLSDIYECPLIHMDDFFLQLHQRTRERLGEPGGNVDYERFKEEVLEHLGDKAGFVYQVFDCSVGKLTRKVKVPFSEIIIVEGSYSSHPYFEDVFDLSFFMETSREVQKERIRIRNGEEMLKVFMERWIPMENRYFEAFQIREKSILIK